MITLQTVDSSDLIDDGRMKLNRNDETLADGTEALASQILNHNHDNVYFTKADVDAMKKGAYRFVDFYIDNLLAVTVCALPISRIPLSDAGKLVSALVQRVSGGSNEVGGEVEFQAGDFVSCGVHYQVSDSWASISDPLILKNLMIWVSILEPNGRERGRIEVPIYRSADADQFAVVAMLSQ